MRYKNFIFITTFYTIFFFIGFLTYKDYGIGIEEIFQRANGFYWLDILLSSTDFSKLKDLTNYKLQEVYDLNPLLPKVADNLIYGIIFDLPASIVELFFNFEDFKQNIHLKHLLCFATFVLSGVFFSLFLIKRFSNFFITFFGTLSYSLSPKIYGASFFDGKDLFFLSLFTISIYFYQSYELKRTYISLILFALFSAFLTSSRLPGLMVFLSFLTITIFEILNKYKIKENAKIILIFTFSFSILLYVHWPFLWDVFNYNYDNLIGESNVTFFFNGEFYKQDAIPLSYIPTLILFSNPIDTIILFSIGFFLSVNFFFKKLISIDKNLHQNFSDFWDNNNEKIDFFILLCVFQSVIIYFSFNDNLTASWRHFFFAHFFLIFYFCYFLNFLLNKFEKRNLKIFLSIILILFKIEIIYKLYIYHPYQYTYFNNLLSDKQKLMYERDTAHLSRYDAMSEILLNEKKYKKIKIGNASASPLLDVLFMFPKKQIEKIELIGNDNLKEADYIYTNYIYEVNINFNNKYEIPKNFSIYKTVVKDGNLIYSIYKKK
tara:strand:+ start:1635 stop:3272 length:1638 start_codon:yes stop_codon:yes gene_type:complete